MSVTRNKHQKGFVPVKKALSSKQNPKLAQAFNQYQIKQKWNQALAGFFDNTDGQTMVVDFREGVLWVACLSRELAYEIKLLAKRILETLNKLLGRTLVFGLRVET